MKEKILQELPLRAKKALLNRAEISPEVVSRATDDAIEVAKGRSVLYFILEDFAYIRLKIYLKIDLSPEDELLYQNAIKAIEKSPFIDTLSGELKSPNFRGVKTRDDLL